MNPFQVEKMANNAIMHEWPMRVTYKREEDGKIIQRVLEPKEVRSERRMKDRRKMKYVYAMDRDEGPGNYHIKKFICENFLNISVLQGQEFIINV